VFKVAAKMFALSTLDRTRLEVSVKCEPEIAVDLRELRRDPSRLPSQQAPLEHDHAGRQTCRPAGK